MNNLFGCPQDAFNSTGSYMSTLILFAALFAYIFPFRFSLQFAWLQYTEAFFQTSSFVKKLLLLLYLSSLRMSQLCFSFPGKPGKSIPWLRGVSLESEEEKNSFVIKCLTQSCILQVNHSAAVL